MTTVHNVQKNQRVLQVFLSLSLLFLPSVAGFSLSMQESFVRLALHPQAHCRWNGKLHSSRKLPSPSGGGSFLEEASASVSSSLFGLVAYLPPILVTESHSPSRRASPTS